MSMYSDHIIYHPGTLNVKGGTTWTGHWEQDTAWDVCSPFDTTLPAPEAPFFCVTSSKVLTTGPFLDFVSVLGAVWAFLLVAGDTQQPWDTQSTLYRGRRPGLSSILCEVVS